MDHQPRIRKALEALEELQAHYRQKADDLTTAISALRELDDTAEFSATRRAAIDAAKGLLTPEALAVLDLGRGAVVTKKREQSPLLQRRED